jgi:leucine--tRNA ligase
LEKIITLWDKVDLEKKEENPEIETLLHQTIKKLTIEIDEFKFNTSISQLMILVNKLSEIDQISKQTFEALIIMLAPFAPHLAEEFWEKLGNEFSLFTK